MQCSAPTWHMANRMATAALCFLVVHRRRKPFSKMSETVNCLKQFLNYAHGGPLFSGSA
jgi:hypothetical protein